MDSVLRYLHAPPVIDTAPPVRTRAQRLPLDELDWPNFERLCLRVAEERDAVEDIRMYGVPGQKQRGIDILARHADDDHTVYQCRRVRRFTTKQLEKVVDDFLAGGWADRARTLTLCTSASLERTELTEMVETQKTRLKEDGVKFVALDAAGLSRALKRLPGLVLDFFDRAWLEEFCPDAPAELAPRLGAAGMHRLRRRLATLYGNVFEQQDTAVLLRLGGDGHRPFVVQDVIERREVPPGIPATNPAEKADGAEPAGTPSDGAGQRTVEQRLTLTRWLARTPQHVLSADAGSGKSTVLRFIAGDLLEDEPQLGELMSRWGAYLPVWLPFGFWVKRIAAGRPPALSEAVRGWLEEYDEGALWPLVEEGLADGRIVLLVDGLDEWSDADAAARAFSLLGVFVKQRGAAVLGTSRPEALEELGPLPAGWRHATLAGLTPAQQIQLLEGLDPDGASRLLGPLERSPELQGLARTPLLLVLMLWMVRADSDLPRGRYAVYGQALDYLLRRHPRLRERSAVAPLPHDEMLSALAALAHAMHRTGRAMIELPAAERVLSGHLAGGGLSGGDGDPPARAAARAVLADAHGRLGVLVAAAPGNVAFLHRVFQEHLSAIHLAGLPGEQIQRAVAACATEPQWREVLANLLALKKDPADADQIIEAIIAGRTAGEQAALQPLMADILAAGHGTPPLRESLSRDVLQTIETAPVSNIREQTLTRLLQAPAGAPEHASQIESWLPGIELGRAGVIDAMGRWPADEETAASIWRGLFDEDTACARAAARAHLHLHREQPRRALRQLADLLRRPVEARARAAALEVLAAAPAREPVAEMMRSAARSADPNLRLVAHDWRIARCEHTRTDLADLLAMGGRFNDVDYDRQGDVPRLIHAGWPGDPEVKELALRALGPMREDDALEHGVALWLALTGYPGDQDVIDYCLSEIEHARFPFLMLHHQAWQLLAAGFRDEPSLTAAIDRWIPAQQYHEPEVSFAAQLGRTDIAKATMIAALPDAGHPPWYVRSLLEGWGMQDPQVAAALADAARGETRVAGAMAHSLPRILTDRTEILARLRELTADPANRRPGIAVHALAEQGALDPATVDAALVRPDMKDPPDSELWHALVEHAPGDPRVRKLAVEYLDSEWYSPAAVADAYSGDAEMRGRLRRRATPLPATLRTRAAELLGDRAGPAALAVTVSDLFLAESDPLAAAVQARTRVRRAPDGTREELTERVNAGLSILGPTFERARQAALAAALELGRADLFADAREPQRPEDAVEIGLSDFLTPNVVLAGLVVEHWDELEELVEDLPGRLSRRGSLPITWDTLALVAERSDTVTERALAYVDERHGVSANLLRLYAAVRPGDTRLKALSIELLKGGQQIPSTTGQVYETAAELLGSEHAGDPDVLAEIMAAGLPESSLLLVLAEGWPDSRELRALHRWARRERLPMHRDTLLRVSMGADEADRALAVLRGQLGEMAASPRFFERPVTMIARRLRRDPEFAGLLETVMLGEGSASETASFARLLAHSGAISAAGRERLSELAGRAFEGELALEVGYDIHAGRRRPLAWALMDAAGAW
jgi:hypothetical protein